MLEQYNIIKNQNNDRLIFKLSQIGYALNCNLLFTSRIPSLEQNVELANHLKTGDKIYISLGESCIDLHRLVFILKSREVKVYFYILNEPITPYTIIQLLYPVALGFYISNNCYEDSHIHCMPIGIRDCEKVVPGHKGFTHDYLFKEQLNNIKKEYMCLLVFSYNHNERYRCYNELKDKSFVTNLNDTEYEKQPSIHCGKVPVWIYYEETHKSIYTLSPRGVGEDTHRFYEAIYLDSIPIVKRTNTAFDKLYNVFPCLIVNDWNEVTEILLTEKKAECVQRLSDFKKNYPTIFTCINDEILSKL
jgi:hypothetical protein